jgi:hypothetical protein
MERVHAVDDDESASLDVDVALRESVEIPVEWTKPCRTALPERDEHLLAETREVERAADIFPGRRAPLRMGSIEVVDVHDGTSHRRADDPRSERRLAGASRSVDRDERRRPTVELLARGEEAIDRASGQERERLEDDRFGFGDRFAVEEVFFAVEALLADAFGGSSSAQSSERLTHSFTLPRRRCHASGRIT